METIKDNEKFKELFNQLKAQIKGTEQKPMLAETSMAIIMKLLRIQYALSHQDELDKQEIFLAGGKEVKNPLDLEVSLD